MAPSKKLPIIFIIIYSTTILAADLTNLIYKGCANQKFQDPSGISSQNLQSLYTSLISQSSVTNYHNATIGNDQLPTSVTGRYQCRGDLSSSDCNVCVKKIPQTIQRVCGGGGGGGGDTIAARVQLEGCYLVYEVVGFPPTTSDQVLYKQCGSGQASGSGFGTRLESAVGEIEKGVGNGKGFYSGAYESVYVLGQCEGDLGNDECVKCVKSAGDNARNACGSSLSGQVYLPRCYVSYTYYPSGVPGSGTSGGGGGIETGATETSGGGGRHNTQKTVAIIIGGLAGLFLGIAFLLVLISAFKKKKEKHYGNHYGVYPKVIVKLQNKDRDENLFSPGETLGLRYLILRFGEDKEARTESKVRRVYVSNLPMPITPMAKGLNLRSEQNKNHQVKEVDCVVQRPRAVLSSPDNDHLIGEMNKDFKRGLIRSKPPTSRRVNLARVDVENARIRVRGTSSPFEVQNRFKKEDNIRPSILKDKKCIPKHKLIASNVNVV